MEFFVNYGCWHCLVGLAKKDPPREQAILSRFWALYKQWRPRHQIWKLVESRGIDLSRTVPLILHADEGRGFKRSAFMIAAYHSYIGRGTQLANSKRAHRSYTQMRLNYCGNSWSHRYVTACLPKMCKDEEAFKSIFAWIADDALDVIHNGVVGSDGTKYWAAVLQCAGDWQFIVKAGNLERSFSRVEKRPRAAGASPAGICHICKAGQAAYPFEDFSTRADWVATQFLQGDYPFTSWPSLLRLPHEEDKPARFFQFDLWHSYHLGLGKTFLGSLLALLSDRQPGGSIDVRFQRLTNLYLQWAEEHRMTPYITSLTKEAIQWPDRKSYPQGNWSKGHVTTTMLKFAVWYLESHDIANEPLLVKSLEAARAINQALTLLYSHDLWLPKALAKHIGSLGLRHLELYQEMAAMCYVEGQALWVFMPKAHVCNHVFLELYTCETEFCMSPLAHAVQQDEDMVGKVSRVSRRVSPMQVIKRVLERVLHASFSHFEQCGYLKSL